MTSLTPQELKILEQTRQRLSLLTNSLASLQQQIENSTPLPPWSTLLLAPQIISQHLATLTTHLGTHHAFLSSLSVYPLPTYPGREREADLNQLLRKKLQPGVEDWVEEGRGGGEGVEGGRRENGEGDGEGGVRGLWEWAGVAANEMAREVEWGGEEAEGEGEESGEEDEEGEGKREGEEGKGWGEGKAVPLEDVLRFLVRGEEGGR